MRELGFVAKKGRKRKQKTTIPSKRKAFKNLINREFDKGHKGAVIVGDITYIRRKDGFLYLSIFMDGHTRKIVGWGIENSMDASLVCNTLRQAYNARQVGAGCIIHTDRGSQYTSSEFVKLAKDYGMTQSMSAAGECFDNSAAESFFDSLKTEMIGDYVFEDLSEAKTAIFEWIEGFYNTRRLHSSLGYLSPVCFESKVVAKAA